MLHRKHINWANTIFLTLTPIVGVVGTIVLCVFGMVSWKTWVLVGFMLIASGLSVTAGYHRLFAHRTYRAAWPARLFFLLFGSATFEGSVLEWSTDHRNHHLYVDTDKDPYNITKGFWHAHMGWLLTLDPDKRDFSNVEDLQEQLLLRLQHKYYVVLAIIMGFGFPTAVASLWGEPLAGLIVAGALCVTICQHSTFGINSICHSLGKRPYNDVVSARDNWFSALLTFGEGYHNYHHKFPLDYRNGLYLHQYDPTKWLICGLSWLGLARHLKRVPLYYVIQAQVERQQRLAVRKYQASKLQQTRDALMETIATLKELDKANPDTKLKGRLLKKYRATRRLKKLFRTWKHLVRTEASPRLYT